MKKLAITIGALAPLLAVSAANAQTVVTSPAAPSTTVVQAAPTQPAVVASSPRETVVSGGPNAMLFKSGLFVFGIPYGASVVVAATSNRDEDKNLYIPVVGPWVDFGNRQTCGNVGTPSCSGETAVKVLLAADGIFQALGAIELVSSFLIHDNTAVVAKQEEKPRFMMAPGLVGATGYGLSAAGTF
jgi:hypothetical protein